MDNAELLYSYDLQELGNESTSDKDLTFDSLKTLNPVSYLKNGKSSIIGFQKIESDGQIKQLNQFFEDIMVIPKGNIDSLDNIMLGDFFIPTVEAGNITGYGVLMENFIGVVTHYEKSTNRICLANMVKTQATDPIGIVSYFNDMLISVLLKQKEKKAWIHTRDYHHAEAYLDEIIPKNPFFSKRYIFQ